MGEVECNLVLKVCTKCRQAKSLDQFWGATKGSGGKQAECCDCVREYRARNKVKLRNYWNDRQRIRRQKEKQERIVYTVAIPDCMKVCCRCKRLKTKDLFYACSSAKDGLNRACIQCRAEVCKEYGKNNRDRVNRTRNLRRLNNPDKAKAESRREYIQAIARHGHNHLLRARLSNGMRRGLSKGSKNGKSAFEILDFTLDELRVHLENQFLPGMSWDNFNEWHIDHIVPIAAFNYSSVTDKDFKRAWCLTNLRPLWGRDNCRKCAARTYLI